MNFKDSTTLRTDLLESYDKLLDIDLSEGTSERDVFIEAPIEGQLKNVWTGLQYLYKLQAPFLYQEDLLVEDLDVYCKENGVGEISALAATGACLLYTSNEPTKDINVNDGDILSNGTVQYEVNGYYSIPYATRSNYYNAITRRYEITVAVTATTLGVAGNAGIGTVNTIVSKIDGLDSCTNPEAISGGKNAGSIIDRVNRVKQLQKGRNLASTNGIQLYVEGFASSVNIVGSNDPLMLRTSGLGGGIDIYIRGEEQDGWSETFNFTSTGLANPENVNYTSTGVILTYQPVSIISSAVKNTVTLNNTYYTLQEDTGILKKSTRGLDKLQLTSTGLAAIGSFKPNDVLEVRYNYNKLLHTIEDDLNSAINQYDNRDYLLREQASLKIHVHLKVQYSSTAVPATVLALLSSSISSSFSTNTSSLVELIDVLALARNTSGIDNVDVPNSYLTPDDGRAKTSNGDVPIYKNEYPILGTLTLEAWS